MIPAEIEAAGPAVKAHYMSMIRDGQTPAFAAMCALRQPPGTKGTERAFMQGRYNQEWLDDMPKRQAQYILAEAKAAGIDTAGRYYCSGIADKRGWCDPESWIEDSSDLLRVARKRDLQVEGSVNYTPPEKDPKRAGLAKDIVDRLSKEEMKKNRKLSRKAAEEIVRDRHTPSWAKKAAKRNK